MKRIIRVQKKNQLRLGQNQQKILLLLMTGLALGLCGSPKQYFRILEACKEDWRSIHNKNFSKSLSLLHRKGLIIYRGNKRDGVYVHLTDRGRREAIRYELNALTIKKPKKWDKKWRIVAFDVPCGKDAARNALRFHLKRLGFEELQQSVFTHPFPARNVVEEIVNYYEINKHVTYMRADKIVGSNKLRKHFKV